jgi:hypothetical protein
MGLIVVASDFRYQYWGFDGDIYGIRGVTPLLVKHRALAQHTALIFHAFHKLSEVKACPKTKVFGQGSNANRKPPQITGFLADCFRGFLARVSLPSNSG